jgi:hypothetical protein
MQKPHIALLLAFILASYLALSERSVFGQEGLSENVLNEIKGATLFIKVNGGYWRASGTGFLFKTEGQIGYVATNAHVVERPTEVHSEGRVTISAIINSGNPSTEVSAPANIVALDHDADLAVLKIQSTHLPNPIRRFSSQTIRETMPLYIFGFPFGQDLQLSTAAGQNPAVTVGKGTISSIRVLSKDSKMYQIQGDLNPGNSGGPVVELDGALVGIAEAKVVGTQIGFVIPYQWFLDILIGRVSQCVFTHSEKPEDPQLSKSESSQGVIYHVKASLIDPLQKLKSVTLLVIPAASVKTQAKPQPDGQWTALTVGMKEVPLIIQGDTARGTSTFGNENGKSVSLYLFQVKATRTDGSTFFTPPGHLVVNNPSGPNTSNSSSSSSSTGKGWLGTGSSSLPQGGGAFPSPNAGNVFLAGPKKMVLDAVVTTLSVDAAKVLPTMIFSADGKVIYLAEKAGVLRKIIVPSFLQERDLVLGTPASSLAISTEGLVISAPQAQALWVVDPGTFQVKRKISAPGAKFVGSAPPLSLAFVADGEGLGIYDLVGGHVVNEASSRDFQQEGNTAYKTNPEGSGFPEFHQFAVSPDGKFLITLGSQCLHRFRIQRANLIYEEYGPDLGHGRVEISGDSDYVALAGGSGNGHLVDHPRIGNGTFVYSISNLSQPILGISTGSIPRVFAFDQAAHKLYTQNYENQLLVFTSEGLKEREYPLSKRGDEVRQILVHPRGKQMLVLTDTQLFWVQLP